MLNFKDREFEARLNDDELLEIYVHGCKVYDDYYIPKDDFQLLGFKSVEILPFFNNLHYTGITCQAVSDGLLLFYNSGRKFAYIEPYILFDILRFTDTVATLNIIVEGKMIFNA